MLNDNVLIKPCICFIRYTALTENASQNRPRKPCSPSTCVLASFTKMPRNEEVKTKALPSSVLRSTTLFVTVCLSAPPTSLYAAFSISPHQAKEEEMGVAMATATCSLSLAGGERTGTSLGIRP